MAFPDGVQQTRFELPEGSVDLPILYRDLTALSATYSADAEKVRQLLPSGDLHAPALRGKCWVTLAAFGYRDTTIGAYNELAVIIPVLHRPVVRGILANVALSRTRWGRLGGYMRHLPVTTKIALEAGKEIWGFPKILADIRVDRRGDHLCCEANAGRGGSILSLKLRLGRGPKVPAPDMVLYTLKDRSILETAIPTRGHLKIVPARTVTLELGRHTIGQELRSLDLSQRPVIAFWSDNLKTRLPLARRTHPL
ncbi:MAG: acetoacetate decarboxylase family protein [Nitrospirae bacterium]|nr:acetoacetate decarboxylase family protein [Nitrospirota bacterium]